MQIRHFIELDPCFTPMKKKVSYPQPTVVEKTGFGLIHDPLYNKGTAWPPHERDRLGLRGLIPPSFLDMNVCIIQPLDFQDLT